MQITKKSLSKLSFDDTNNKIVCNYQNEFIDLDTTKGILKKQQTPKTPDMLYINDEQKELWFVEFKSSTRDIEFGLEDLKPQFIEDIFTDNCNNFKQLFEKRFNIKFEN
jgi:hypothetical protein